jgi:hypothetical protein
LFRIGFVPTHFGRTLQQIRTRAHEPRRNMHRLSQGDPR